jgi:hypothetical protein
MSGANLILFPYDGWHNVGIPPQRFTRAEVEGFTGPRSFPNDDHSWIQLGFEDTMDFLDPPPKPANELRVIVIGGSGAQGQDAPVPERFDLKLEKLLNDELSGTQWHVRFINMAMGGSMTYQNFIAIDRWGVRLEPDIILSYSGRNDLWVTYQQGSDAFYMFSQLSYLAGLLDYSIRDEEPRFMRLFAKYLPRIYERTPIPFHLKDMFFGPEYRQLAIRRYREQFGLPDIEGDPAAYLRTIEAISIPLQVQGLKSIKRDLLGVPIVVSWQYTNKADIYGNNLSDEIYDHMFERVREESTGYCNGDWIFINTHDILRDMADPSLGGAHLTPKGHTVLAGLLLEPMHKLALSLIKRRTDGIPDPGCAKPVQRGLASRPGNPQ